MFSVLCFEFEILKQEILDIRMNKFKKLMINLMILNLRSINLS